MFRYASISSINSCRSICTNAARNNIINCKTQLMKTSYSYMLLTTRSESTGTCRNISNACDSAVSSGSVSPGSQVNPSVLNVANSSSSNTDVADAGAVTETVLSSGAVSSAEKHVDSVATEKLVDSVAAENLVDSVADKVARTSTEEIEFTFDSLAISIQETEKAVTTLAEIGDATLRSPGVASNWLSGLVQQALEVLQCGMAMPSWVPPEAGGVGKSTVSKSTQADPSDLFNVAESSNTGVEAVTETVLSPGTVPTAETHVDPAVAEYGPDSEVIHTLNEQLYFIPDALVFSIKEVEKVVSALAANGEPTLRSLGLADNWPSGLAQQALEFLHCDVGLQWWVAIMTGTCILRLFFYPLEIKSLQKVAKMNSSVPQMQTVQITMMEDDISVFTKKKMNIYSALWLPFSKALISANWFLGLNAMANLPVESMKTGGILWFQDLTLADPFYILPLITGATLFINLKMGTVKLPNSRVGQVRKYAKGVIPIVVLYLSKDCAAAPMFCFATWNVVFLGQELLLRIPEVRYKLNIGKRVEHDPDNLPVARKGFKTYVDDFREKLNAMSKDAKEAREMEAVIDRAIFKAARRDPIIKTYRYDPTKPPPPSRSTIKTNQVKSIKSA